MTRKPQASTEIRVEDEPELVACRGVAVEDADEEGSQLLVHAKLLSYHLAERRASPLIINLRLAQPQSTTPDPRSTFS